MSPKWSLIGRTSKACKVFHFRLFEGNIWGAEGLWTLYPLPFLLLWLQLSHADKGIKSLQGKSLTLQEAYWRVQMIVYARFRKFLLLSFPLCAVLSSVFSVTWSQPQQSKGFSLWGIIRRSMVASRYILCLRHSPHFMSSCRHVTSHILTRIRGNIG